MRDETIYPPELWPDGWPGSWKTLDLPCLYCGQKAECRDHLVPLHKNGRVVVPCCRKCNAQKWGSFPGAGNNTIPQSKLKLICRLVVGEIDRMADLGLRPPMAPYRMELFIDPEL